MENGHFEDSNAVAVIRLQRKDMYGGVCMDIIIILVVAAATLGAGLLGVYVQGRLPDEHKSDAVRATIGQVAGLVTLLLALVMGTVIGVSYSFFATQKAGLEVLSAPLLQ